MKSDKYISKSADPEMGKEATSGHLHERDEHIIWELFKRGDEQSLIYIYRKYADILYNYGCQFTTRRDYISDCVQELFYELIDRRKRLSEVRSVKAYLFSSLKRRIFKGLKKEEQFQLMEGGLELGFFASSISLSQTLEKEDYAIIEKELNRLPAQQKEVILLHFYEGMSYTEIADIMGIKVKSARALTYRALKSLTKKLSPYKRVLSVLLLFMSGQM